MIKAFLDDLESRIDAAEEENFLRRWKDFYEGKITDNIFLSERKNKHPSRLQWPQILINEAIRADGYEKMLLSELKSASDTLAHGAGSALNVRSNYGTGIMPSAFGAELFFMDDSHNTLPTSIPFEGQNKIREIADNGIPSRRIGLMQKSFEFAEYFLEATKPYPKIGKYVFLYHPDFQGPMDVTELLWGSSLFLDVYDSPDLLKGLLEMVTDTYINFMQQWNEIAPLYDHNYSAHWGLIMKGRVALRNDSAMNFSPEMYDEFIHPYDQKIFDAFGGGMMHFCGRGSHYIANLAKTNNLFEIAMSQPHLNDMDTIYAHTIEKDIRLIGFNYNVAMEAQTRGVKFHGKLHCIPPT